MVPRSHLLVDGLDQTLGVWTEGTNRIIRKNATEPLTLHPGESPEDGWRRVHGGSEQQRDIRREELVREPGTFWKRMAFPDARSGVWTSALKYEPQEHEQDLIGSVVAQNDWLLVQLDTIFQTLEPSTENAGAYGHTIRNLLIIAATEVEALCRGVLESNGYSSGRSARWNIKDYRKVAEPLRLNDYALRLARRPSYGEVRPFAAWQPASPSDCLPWYSAYNKVKHDREGSFSEARLEHVISAVAACCILLRACFAPPLRVLTPYFTTASEPRWERHFWVMPNADYTPLRPVNYSF